MKDEEKLKNPKYLIEILMFEEVWCLPGMSILIKIL